MRAGVAAGTTVRHCWQRYIHDSSPICGAVAEAGRGWGNAGDAPAGRRGSYRSRRAGALYWSYTFSGQRMRLRRPFRVTIVLVSALSIPAATAQETAIVGVGDLPGGPVRSQIVALSADGATAVGTSYVADTVVHGFVWRRGTGIVDMGEPPGGSASIYPQGVSGDGEVIVGRADGFGAFRWSHGSSFEPLIPGLDPLTLEAPVISADGNVIFAQERFGDPLRVVRWTAAQGIEDIGLPPPPEPNWPGSGAEPSSTSFNGDRLGARSDHIGETRYSFRWEQVTGWRQLRACNLRPGPVLVAGTAPLLFTSCFDGSHRWSGDSSECIGGFLPNPGCETFHVRGVSADGSIGVFDACMLWFARDNGLRPIDMAVRHACVPVEGLSSWTIQESVGMSHDGRVVAGNGIAPDGTQQGWVMSLGPEIFEPLLGDMDCDGAVNNFDIDPFVLALTDPLGYNSAYPECCRERGDFDGDFMVTNFDIDPFVQRISGR